MAEDTVAVVTAVDMEVGIMEAGIMEVDITEVEDIEAVGFVARTAADIMAVITARCTTIR